MSRDVRITCSLDLENTFESLHAYAIPEGIDIRPGDVMTIHDAPVAIASGQQLRLTRTATIRRAGPLRRAWTRASSVFSLTSLYEVGFEPRGSE